MNQKLIKGGYTRTSNKGITLIALVITIIVLLILAGVTMSMVLGDEGIIAQAQNAKEAQENAIGRDEGVKSSAEGLLSRYLMSKYDDVKGENSIAKQNSTINGERASSENPVIPKGFKAVNEGEAVWGAAGAVDKGLVIQDEAGNEFVWVPVLDITKFAKLQEGTTNYRGVLWDFGTSSSPEENPEEKIYVLNGGYRETDVVTGNSQGTGSSYDGNEANRKAILDDGYENSVDGLREQFQDEFNAMVESVKAYGGFYVGRYETGWVDGKVVSKAGIQTGQIFKGDTDLGTGWTTEKTGDDANKATWYGLYAKQKELYKKNSSSSVISGMIYGCQWDAIMKWMQSDSSTADYVTNSSGKGVYYGMGGPLATGQYDVKNIYDLAGNYRELTQEANYADYRVVRGGAYNEALVGEGTDNPASVRANNTITNTNNYTSSRLQLYIK